MDLAVYQAKKNRVKQLFQEIRTVANDCACRSVSQELSESLVQIEDDGFNLVVVGEFSRGKSTFINALLGKRILPSKKSATTAVITKICYGEKAEFILYYHNSRSSKNITQDEFKGILAPKEAKADDATDAERYERELSEQKKFDYIKIHYPLELCASGVEIVDTPGVNDLNTDRVDITYRYLHKADAVILLLSARQLYSASERIFLRENILNKQIAKIFIVVNRCDGLTKQEKDGVLDYLAYHIKQDLPENIAHQTFLVSSKQALTYRRRLNGEEILRTQDLPENFSETGFEELEKQIADYLENDRGYSKLKKYVQRGVSRADEIIQNSINIKLASYRTTIDVLEEKLREMQPKFQKVRYEAKSILSSLEVNLMRDKNDFSLKVSSGMDEILAAALDAVDECVDAKDRGMIINNVQKHVGEAQKKVLKEIEEEKRRQLRHVIYIANEKIKNVWNDINVTYQKELVPVQNLNLPTVEVYSNQIMSLDFNEDTEAFLKGALGAGAIFAVVNAPVLLLGALFFADKIQNAYDDYKRSKNIELKNDIKNKLRQVFSGQSTKMIQQVEADYRSSFQELSGQIEQTIYGRLSDMEHQLNAAIAEKKSSQRDIEARIQYLLKAHNYLETAKTNLKGVL